MRVHDNRILFLKHFTSELIMNSKQAETMLIENIPNMEFVPELQPSIKNEPEMRKPLIENRFTEEISQERTPKLRYAPVFRSLPIQIPQFQKSLDIDLGKINIFFNDPRINSIECSGPDKFITVITNKQELTRISLNEKEIQDIINKFSTLSNTKIIGGLLKARVNNYTITAVVSEIIGSRFMISKI